MTEKRRARPVARDRRWSAPRGRPLRRSTCASRRWRRTSPRGSSSRSSRGPARWRRSSRRWIRATASRRSCARRAARPAGTPSGSSRSRSSAPSPASSAPRCCCSSVDSRRLLQVVVIGLLTFVGFVLPDSVLGRQRRGTAEGDPGTLSDTLDLLTISVEAGLSLNAAIAQVVQNVPGVLSSEFARMLQEIQLGCPAFGCVPASGGADRRRGAQRLRARDDPGRRLRCLDRERPSDPGRSSCGSSVASAPRRRRSRPR